MLYLLIHLFIQGYDDRMEHTQCLGQPATTINCPEGTWILMHKVYTGYTANTDDNTTTWCANDRACNQSYANYHIATSYRSLTNVIVPADQSITCGGQLQTVNYVYFEYSCINGKQCIAVIWDGISRYMVYRCMGKKSSDG